MGKTKKDALRQINVKPELDAGGSLIEQTAIVAPPAIIVGNISAPTGLVLLSTTIARSTQSPMAYINIDWNPPYSVTPEYYEVEYGKQSDWTGTAFNNPQRVRAFTSDAALLADANKAYFVRVRAVYKSTASRWTDNLSVVTAVDTTPPDDLTTASASFANGNLIVLWGYTSTPDNFKHVEIKVWNDGKTILYGTYYNATGRFVWTEAENLRTTSGVGVTNVDVEVTPISWANTAGTTEDLSAVSANPSPVTGLTFDFASGDLDITWTNPTTIPFNYIEVKIYRDSSRAVLYRTLTTQSEGVRWTVDMNFADTSRVGGSPIPDPSVVVDVRVIGWIKQVSSTVSDTATKALPSPPTGLTSTWAGDTGVANEDVVFSWDAASNVKDYELSVNGVVRGYIADISALYTWSINVEHNGLPGDPTLAVAVKSRDRLNQLSATAASITATNAAPDNSDFSLTFAPGFTTVGGIVELLTTIQDYKAVRWTVKQGGSPVKTLETDDNIVIINDLPSGTYTLEAQVIDMFDQASAANVTSSFALDSLTVENLRKESIYSDSIGSTETQLAVLKDNNNSSGGALYTSPASGSYRWTRFERTLLDRYRPITISFSAGTGTGLWYLRTSIDGSTWKYYAGPMSVSLSGVLQLVEVANEAAARANLITSASYGNVSSPRVELPTIIEARYIEIWHATGTLGQTYTLQEFYPRRLVQSDDIEAESIKGINILGSTITGDKIFGTELSAIKTSTGQLIINTGGHIRSGQTAYDTGVGFFLENNGGTPRFSLGNSAGTKLTWSGTTLTLEGAGLVIRTASSGSRVQINNTGLYGYNGSTEQVRIQSSDGKLVGAAGVWTVDATGVHMTVPAITDWRIPSTYQYKWYYAGNVVLLIGGGYATDVGVITGWQAKGHNNTTPGAIYLESTLLNNTRIAYVHISEFGVQVSDLSSASSVYSPVFDTSSSVGNVYRIAGRHVISDMNDNWLRLNNSGDYTNGVFVASPLRVFSLVTSSGASAGYRFLDRSDNSREFLWYSTGSEGILWSNVAGDFLRMRHDGLGMSLKTPQQQNVTLRIGATGTTNSHYPIIVANSANTATLFYVRVNTSTTATGYLNDTAWIYASDESLKDDIKELKTQKAKFKNLKAKSFRYKGNTKDSVGFVAQDIQDIYPELVEEVELSEGRTVLGVKTTDFIPILVKELQELEETVETLQVELATLKKKIK